MGAKWYGDYLDVRAELDRLRMGAAGRAFTRAVLNAWSPEMAEQVIGTYRDAIAAAKRGETNFLSGIEAEAQERREKARAS